MGTTRTIEQKHELDQAGKLWKNLKLGVYQMKTFCSYQIESSYEIFQLLTSLSQLLSLMIKEILTFLLKG